MNYNVIINDILCKLKNLQETIIKKIRIKFNNEEVTDDVSSINFTGNVEVTSDILGNTTVNIPTQSGGDCDTCLEFDADRPITRNVLGMLGQNLGTQGVIATLEELLYPYLAPSVTLSSPSASVFEKQSGTTNITITATSVKNTDDITSLKFFLGATEVYNEGSINASGQTSSYVYAADNTDGTDATAIFQVFKAVVDDGTTQVNSNTRTRTLVYPYYYGSSGAAANAATIQALTKHVAIAGEKGYVFSPSNQKIYMAYPASYGALVEINDGALNLTGAFTLRTDTFTMLDGQSVTYNIYESNNLLTISGYELNFIL